MRPAPIHLGASPAGCGPRRLRFRRDRIIRRAPDRPRRMYKESNNFLRAIRLGSPPPPHPRAAGLSAQRGNGGLGIGDAAAAEHRGSLYGLARADPNADAEISGGNFGLGTPPVPPRPLHAVPAQARA